MTVQLILLALAPVLAIAWYVWLRDKYEREPLKHIVISFILGCLSTIPAILLEQLGAELYPLDEMNLANVAVFSFIIIAGAEELSKFVMLRLYAFRQKEFNEAFDGIVYGVMVSLGFAALENILYVAEGGWTVALLRMFTAVPAHASFGVLMGYYVGLAWKHKEHSTKYMIRGLLSAIVFHGAYDFFLIQQNMPAFWFMSFIGLAIAIRLSFKAMKAHNENSAFNPKNQEIE